MNQYVSQGAAVIDLDVDSRSRFISRTYGHLTGAIFAFTGIEVALFKTGLAEKIATAMGGMSWLVILGAFMVVSWMASGVAHRAVSKAAQYAALGAFVFMWAIMFVPLLYMADTYVPGAISSAALVTFIGFAGLTATVFVTRQDFSFLGGILRWGGVLAIVAIVCGVIFNWNMGMWFSVAMVGFAGAAILYDTSNVLHHYPEDRYVAAALELFASVALMLWYVLRLFIFRGND